MTGTLHMLIPLLYWGGLVGLLAWAMTGVPRGEGETAKVGSDSTEDLLRAQFARGEICPEEYDHALEVLHARHPVVNNGS